LKFAIGVEQFLHFGASPDLYVIFEHGSQDSVSR